MIMNNYSLMIISFPSHPFLEVDVVSDKSKKSYIPRIQRIPSNLGPELP